MHRLSDLLAMATLATLCGAQGWTDVALWCRCKQHWLQTFLILPHGIPSYDTFGRVLGMLNPDAFGRCFQRWTRALSAKARHGGVRLLAAARDHWDIENRLHWRLDGAMGEDACLLRQHHAAENFSRLRRLALNFFLQQDPTYRSASKPNRKPAAGATTTCLKSSPKRHRDMRLP